MFAYEVRGSRYVQVCGLAGLFEIAGWSRGVAVCGASLEIVTTSGGDVFCECWWTDVEAISLGRVRDCMNLHRVWVSRIWIGSQGTVAL